MCLGIYLATNSKLELIPWDPNRPALNLGPLSPAEQPVRTHFSLPQVYYVGSHTQCGCGFSPSEEPDETARLDSVSALATYLHTLAQTGPLELFVCWDGEYAALPERRLQLTTRDLITTVAWLGERSFVSIPHAAA